ncbi:MAG: tetratricopeptide repeat protein [Candidatus Zixiibacteriota bacterium]|nr:MAG: tetratricopeptide repeat protein [candidate division Zixibacteria bacterium]
MRGRVRNRTLSVFAVAILVVALASLVSSQNIKPEIENAIQIGDTTLAINLLDREIDIDPSNPWNYYTKGVIFYERQQYQQAAEQFETALDKRSKHYESLYQLGLCYLKMGELEKAQETMEEGRKKDKKNKHVFEDGYGEVMLAMENWQEADRAFRQAIVGDSTNPQYHIHLGDANFYQGVPALAILEYEKALEVDTGSLEVYYHWAEACLEMKDYTCAIEKLRIVLTKDSTHAPAWMRAGGIYFRAGLSSRNRNDRSDRFRDAIGSYKRYLELSGAQPDASNVRVFFEMAMSYSNLGGYEDAADYFEKVLAVPIEPRDIYFHYGKAVWYNKDYVKAAELLQKHLEWVGQQDESYNSNVDESEVYQFLGDSYFYRKPKEFMSAIQYYKKSLDGDPNQQRILNNIAVAYHSVKSYAQALEYYDRRIALGIDSTSASVYKNAGRCALSIAYQDGEEDEEDIDDIDEEEVAPAVTANPDVNYFQLSVDYFQQYLQFDDKDLDVLERIASTYLYHMADCTNGVKYYEQVLTVDAKNCDAQKALGYAYFGGICTKNYSRALRYLRQAQDCLSASGGECADPSLSLWIAQCYHLRAVEKTEQKQDGTDDFRNAHTWYSQVLKCEPGNREAKEGRDQVEYEF